MNFVEFIRHFGGSGAGGGSWESFTAAAQSTKVMIFWPRFKGRLRRPDWMNFRKTFKRPLTPHPSSFQKTILRFFSGGPEICIEIFWEVFRKFVQSGSRKRP